jgi:hypothetical protein
MISADREPVAAAVETLLEGVNEEERGRGCESFFSSSTAGALREIRRSDRGDTLAVDLRDFTGALPDAPGVKSFLPPNVMAELTWTLFHQFPQIEALRFSFDGDEGTFWVWLGGPGAA